MCVLWLSRTLSIVLARRPVSPSLKHQRELDVGVSLEKERKASARCCSTSFRRCSACPLDRQDLGRFQSDSNFGQFLRLAQSVALQNTTDRVRPIPVRPFSKVNGILDGHGSSRLRAVCARTRRASCAPVDICISFSVSRSLPVRFGLWRVRPTRAVRVIIEHSLLSSPETVSTHSRRPTRTFDENRTPPSAATRSSSQRFFALSITRSVVVSPSAPTLPAAAGVAINAARGARLRDEIFEF